MYVVKIDLRKKHLFDDGIRDCVSNNELWCNDTEDGYTTLGKAKKFETKDLAVSAITERWEMVCKV